MARKRQRPRKKSGGGAMSGMRSGFKGVFDKKKSGKADPKQFVIILASLFALGALIFFGTR